MPVLSNASAYGAIDTLWLANENYINVSSITVPFPRHEFIINMGDTFEVEGAGYGQSFLFSPIATKAIHTRAKGRYHALGAMFNPVGLYKTFGLSLNELHQQARKSPKDLLFDQDEALWQELNLCTKDQEKLQVLAAFFKRNSHNRTVPKVVTNFFAGFSNKRSAHFEVKEMAKGLGFTSKHLINSFKDVVGLTPKQYTLLLQVNVAVHSIWKSPSRSLTEIALSAGFFDQSHFIRVFKRITGLTPLEFRNAQNRSGSEFANTILE